MIEDTGGSRSKTPRSSEVDERDKRLDEWGKENDEFEAQSDGLEQAHQLRISELLENQEEAQLKFRCTDEWFMDVLKDEDTSKHDTSDARKELLEANNYLQRLQQELKEEYDAYELKKKELDDQQERCFKRRSTEADNKESSEDDMTLEDFMGTEEEEGEGTQEEGGDGYAEGGQNVDTTSTPSGNGNEVSRVDLSAQQEEYHAGENLFHPHPNRFAPLANLRSSASSLPARSSISGSPCPPPPPSTTPVSTIATQNLPPLLVSPPAVPPSFASPDSSLFPDPPTSSPSSPAPEPPSQHEISIMPATRTTLALRCDTRTQTNTTASNTDNNDNDSTATDPCRITITPPTPVDTVIVRPGNDTNDENDDSDDEGLYDPPTPPGQHSRIATRRTSSSASLTVIITITRVRGMRETPDDDDDDDDGAARAYLCELSDGTTRWVPEWAIADAGRCGRVREFVERAWLDGGRGEVQEKTTTTMTTTVVDDGEQEGAASSGNGNDRLTAIGGDDDDNDDDVAVASTVASVTSSRMISRRDSPLLTVVSAVSVGPADTSDRDTMVDVEIQGENTEGREQKEKDGKQEERQESAVLLLSSI